MDHYTAVDLLREWRPTWGQIRDHLLDRMFGDGHLPDTSTVNRGVSITQAFHIYDRALAVLPADTPVDTNNGRDMLLAANVVRDFGCPAAALTQEGQ